MVGLVNFDTLLSLCLEILLAIGLQPAAAPGIGFGLRSTIAVLVDFCLKTPKEDFSHFSVILWPNL